MASRSATSSSNGCATRVSPRTRPRKSSRPRSSDSRKSSRCPGGKLEDKYETLNKQLERSEDKAKKVHDHIGDSGRRVEKDLFKEWDQELGKYFDRKLRAESERELAETRRRAAALMHRDGTGREEDYAGAAAAARPRALPEAQPQRCARQSDALQQRARKHPRRRRSLIVELEQSIKEADTFIKEMDAENAAAGKSLASGLAAQGIGHPTLLCCCSVIVTGHAHRHPHARFGRDDAGSPRVASTAPVPAPPPTAGADRRAFAATSDCTNGRADAGTDANLLRVLTLRGLGLVRELRRGEADRPAVSERQGIERDRYGCQPLDAISGIGIGDQPLDVRALLGDNPAVVDDGFGERRGESLTGLVGLRRQRRRRVGVDGAAFPERVDLGRWRRWWWRRGSVAASNGFTADLAARRRRGCGSDAAAPGAAFAPEAVAGGGVCAAAAAGEARSTGVDGVVAGGGVPAGCAAAGAPPPVVPQVPACANSWQSTIATATASVALPPCGERPET